MLTSLLDGAHLAPPDSIAEVIATSAATTGVVGVMYLVDYEQRT